MRLSSDLSLRRTPGSQEPANPPYPVGRGHAPLLPIDRHQRRGHSEIEVCVKRTGHPAQPLGGRAKRSVSGDRLTHCPR